jgi:hypothetical protein
VHLRGEARSCINGLGPASVPPRVALMIRRLGSMAPPNNDGLPSFCACRTGTAHPRPAFIRSGDG